MMAITVIETGPGYSLAETCGPVAWGGGRWPNQDWIDGKLIYVSRDERGLVVRSIEQPKGAGGQVVVESDRSDIDHQVWSDRVLGVRRKAPSIADATIAALAQSFAGMRPFCNASLFESILTAIIGQSISVQAAAVTERKLCELYAQPIEMNGRFFWPHPSVEQIATSNAETVRRSGVTQRRADGIVHIARMAASGNLIGENDLLGDIERGMVELIKLPMIGKWTAESILLWGYGADDSYPIGDVALLRAARLAYQQPAMTHKEMDAIAHGWRPGRSWAARWLWINLFGPAPAGGSGN